MLNEHEREDGPEDGEYHFSDEGGYEPHLEEEAKPPVISEGRGLAAKLSSYRRFVIIGAIAAGVLLVAYLAIPPLTTTAPTEIAAVTPPSTPAHAPAEAPVVQKPLAVAAPLPSPAKTSVVEEPKAASLENHKATKSFALLISEEKEKLVAEKNKIESHFEGQPAQASSLKAPAAQPVTALPGSNSEQLGGQAPTGTGLSTSLAAAPSSVVSPAVQEFIAAPIGTLPMAPPQAPAVSAENKAVLDKLTALEETNTRLIGQLQAEYAQKVTDYEMQNKALQEQVRTLNTRLAGMETEMNKLVQTMSKPPVPTGSEGLANVSESNSLNLQSSRPVVIASPGIPPSQPNYKINYTVQAIIPGRAWLRTESGETITVAEGDMLKNLGRVTKIDPYDGTILIDTGGKIVTLTYGSGDYA